MRASPKSAILAVPVLSMNCGLSQGAEGRRVLWGHCRGDAAMSGQQAGALS